MGDIYHQKRRHGAWACAVAWGRRGSVGRRPSAPNIQNLGLVRQCLTSQPKWRWGATVCVYGMDVKHRNKRIEGLATCYGSGQRATARGRKSAGNGKEEGGGGELALLPAAGWLDRPSDMYQAMSQCVGDGGAAKAVRFSCPSEGYITWCLITGGEGWLVRRPRGTQTSTQRGLGFDAC